MASTSRFLLVYGSQTGQSKAIAEELVERCYKVGIDADIHCLSKIEKEFMLEQESLVVIVVSTTGDGEPPDTALKFWRRIKRKTLAKDYFSNVRYSLLGLGDSNYNNHCAFPHMVNDRLLQLGATQFLPASFADDAVGLDIVAEPWIDSLLNALCGIFKLSPPSDDNKAVNAALGIIKDLESKLVIDPSKNSTIPTSTNGELLGLGDTNENSSSTNSASWTDKISLDEVRNLTLPSSPLSYISVEYLATENKACDSLAVQNNCKLPFANSRVYSTPVTNIHQLSAHDPSVKKTLLVVLDCSEFADEYKSGDSFSIIAQNDDREVHWLLKRLDVKDPHELVKLSVSADTLKKRAVLPEYINNPSSLYEIFSNSLDLRSIPKKAMMRLLARWCKDPVEQNKLEILSSRQGSDVYREIVVEARRSILDMLHAFPSCSPPVECLIENLPRLLPRAYSIASASGCKLLKLAFSVVDLPDIGELTARQGLVTGQFNRMYHEHITQLPNVDVYLRTQQHFRLPSDSSKPLILIGPGTGVAPFIGFLEDREKLLEAGVVLGECLLFFGNRVEASDYLFRDDLNRHLALGSLTQLHTCFSRDDHHINKTGAKYVTDLIRQQAHLVSHLIINQSAFIYVCGDAKNMAKDVNQAISHVLQTENGYTDEEVVTVVRELREEKRYKEDVWI